MVRRIRPVSRKSRTETEVRKTPGYVPVRRPGLPDPGEVALPAVDVYAKEGEIVIELELPGVQAKDVIILLYSGKVEVKGLKREVPPAGGGFRFLRLEREYGAFRREVVLPAAVEAEKAFASLENGILTIVLRKQPLKARDVDIKSGRRED
jgi:HSP20 family molecular chaperone IbpA